MDPITVTVTLESKDYGVKVTVDPFVAVINEEDAIEWKLSSDDYDTADMEIRYKGKNWPFETNPPYKVKKGGSYNAGKAKKGANKNNHYDISCTVRKNGAEPIVFTIDPDIIIIGGAIE